MAQLPWPVRAGPGRVSASQLNSKGCSFYQHQLCPYCVLPHSQEQGSRDEEGSVISAPVEPREQGRDAD